MIKQDISKINHNPEKKKGFLLKDKTIARKKIYPSFSPIILCLLLFLIDEQVKIQTYYYFHCGDPPSCHHSRLHRRRHRRRHHHHSL